MQFLIEDDGPRQWRWRLVGRAGETIARSGEAYPTEVQASAAATAFSQLVTRAQKTMVGSPSATGPAAGFI